MGNSRSACLTLVRKKQTVVWGDKKVAGAIVRPIDFESEPIPVPLQEKLQATTNADGQVESTGFPGASSGLVEVRAKGLGVQTMQAWGRPLLLNEADALFLAQLFEKLTYQYDPIHTLRLH
jgi:hypothetical protein